MADLSALKTRIAGELHRTDLTSQIADAITTAITYYRSHRFEVNEQQASFNTVASQEAYTSGDTGFPTDVGQIDVVRLTQSGRRIVLEPIEFSKLQELSISTSHTRAPSAYAWYTQKLFLYPIPDAVYATQVSYQQRKSAPSSDSDSGTIWTNGCEALIRACAKKLICRDVTYDADGFQRNSDAEREALAVLKKESLQLQDDGSALSSND